MRLAARIAWPVLAFAVIAPAASATSPGHEGRIVFDQGDGLVTARPNGTDIRPFVDGGSLRWSADGTLIAYRRGPGVYVARADGSDERGVFFGDSDGTIGFSPDGRTIVIRRVVGSVDHQRSNLYTVDVATGREELLVHDAQEAVLSPNGRWVAFVDTRGLGISKVRLDGSRRTRVFRGHSVESLDWSPGGRSIAFVQFFSKKLFDRNGQPYRRYYKDLRVIGVRSERIKRLVRRWTGRSSLSTLSWSPTGRRLLVTEWRNDRSRHELLMVGARTARVVRLGVPGVAVSWQPIP